MDDEYYLPLKDDIINGKKGIYMGPEMAAFFLARPATAHFTHATIDLIEDSHRNPFCPKR